MIKLENISKSFNGKNAVDNVSLNIKNGEIFGIIGLSGAGKSTLIRTINKLETPDSGKILVNGKNVLEMNDNELKNFRKKTSMIFQYFNLLSSRTVFENVALPLEIANVGKKEIKERVEYLLNLVGLIDFKNVYVNRLSGGQKQRVAIARSLANNPSILLSDESTSSLDPITANSILELLKDINKTMNITIILITHQLEVIQKICDNVAVMKDGKIIETGTTKQVFLNPQNEFTKNLIRSHVKKVISNKKTILRLIFDEDTVDKSYISILSRDFNVDINILGGDINELKIGNLLVEIPSHVEDEIISWLKMHNVKVEVIK